MKKPMEVPTKVYATIFLVPLVFAVFLSIAGSILEKFVTQAETYQSLGFFFGLVFFLLFIFLAFASVPLFVKTFFHLLEKMQKKGAHPILSSLLAKKERIGNALIWGYWALFLLGLLISSYHFLGFFSAPT